MYYFGVVFLDVKVYHRFVAMIPVPQNVGEKKVLHSLVSLSLRGELSIPSME